MKVISIVCIAALLFFLPFVRGEGYSVGGDDSRLYYVFPEQFLRNWSFHVIGDNTFGGNYPYAPVSYSAPILVFLSIVKKLFPAWNTQSVAFGLILSVGFVAMYAFLRLWDRRRTAFAFVAALLCSLAYIFSLYLVKTFYATQLISIFLVMVLPAGMYLFTKGILEKKITLILLLSLVYSAGSATLLSLPWFGAAGVVLSPFLLYLFFQNKKFFVKAIFVLFVATVLLNFYWLIHQALPFVLRTGETNFVTDILSDAMKRQNTDLISALSLLNAPVNQIAGFLRTSWAVRQGIGFSDLAGIIQIAIIIVAAIQMVRTQLQTKRIFLAALGGLVIAMMLVTPNFGQWNQGLFLWFNNHIPFFTALRNMYDKFAPGMAFISAFCLYTAFLVLEESWKKKTWKYGALLFLLVPLLINSTTLMRNFSRARGDPTYFSGRFNDDFVSLSSYLASMKTTARFIWLPMTFPGYAFISDGAYPNHFYAGLSPLRMLARVGDIAGFYGIQTPAEPELNWRILDFLRQENHEAIGAIFSAQNIGYVILNHELSQPQAKAAMEKFDFMKLQTAGFQKTVLGEKIRDFGTRYSLYEINRKFFIPTVTGASTFRKLPNGSYEIEISQPTDVVLREPYSRFWKLGQTPSRLADGYGNVWEIKVPGAYYIDFWPKSLVWPAVFVSVVTGLGVLLYAIFSLKRT